MGTITPRGAKWRVQIRRKGFPPQSRTFHTYADAQRWDREMECQLDRGFVVPPRAVAVPIREYLQRYAQEVAPAFRSVKTELGRLRTLETHLGAYTTLTLTSQVLAAFRQRRLQTHAPQTVTHEVKLLRRVLRRAQAEWGAQLPHGVPELTPLRLPRGRDRVVSVEEEQRLLAVLTEPMRSLVILAVETTARRGELLALRPEHVLWAQHTVWLAPGKTDRPRVVPLTPRALACLAALPQTGRYFTLHPDSVHHAFKRACQAAGIPDCRFHDLRHTGTTRLAEQGLSTVELALFTGHRDLAMLSRYAHPEAAKLAMKLATPAPSVGSSDGVEK